VVSTSVVHGMARFVILLHELSGQQRGGAHFDFMLEQGAILRTWALGEKPTAGREIIAHALADHRIDYLEYEGPVSKNRGSVSRWDFGTYESLVDSQAEIIVQLRGQQLTGTAHLRPAGEKSQPIATEPQRWIFSFSV